MNILKYTKICLVKDIYIYRFAFPKYFFLIKSFYLNNSIF